MNDLIHRDISRCNNYKCQTNVFCARFNQIHIDLKKENRSICSTTTFNMHDNNGLCDYFINARSNLIINNKYK